MDSNQQPPIQQNPIPQPLINTIPPSKSKWKWILFIIILLIIVGGGAYYLGTKQNTILSQNQQAIIPAISQSAPTVDPTVNWKTYIDNTYNFSFQYPDNWSQSKSTYREKPSLQTISFYDPNPPEAGIAYEISIEIFPNPNKLSSADYIQKEAFKRDLSGWDNNKQTATSVSSTIDALKINSLIGGAGSYGPVVFISTIPAGTNIIKMKWSPLGRDSGIFNKVISTFKFTDQNQTINGNPTVNWKTYVNTKIGFQIKYPPRYPKPGLPSGAPGSPTLYADKNTDNNDLIFGLTSSDSIDLIVFPYAGSLDELKNYKNLPIVLPSYEMSLIKNIQVDGVEAQWYGTSPEIGATNIYFIGADHGFILHSQFGHNQEEIGQMLSSFKFLVDCSLDVDNVCPSWCSAGSDVDCCNEKPGYAWIQGRGCYEK